MGAQLALGCWPICDQLLLDAEAIEGFAEQPQAQAELVYQLGNPNGGYWHLTAENRQAVISRLITLIPRVALSKEPKITAERLFRLWHGPTPFESIGRALSVTRFEPRPWLPEEKLYLTGGFLDDFTGWCSESDSPLRFLWWGGVACLAAVSGFRFYVDRRTDNLRLGTVYVILCGEAGTLKSVGLDAAKEVLWHLNHQVYPWEPGTGLPDYNQKNPFAVRFLPEDTNWRTLVGCLKSEPFMMSQWVTPDEMSRDITSQVDKNGQFWCSEHGVLLLDELSVLFGRDNFAVDRLVPGLNAVHGGRPFVYQTQSGGNITLQRPSMTLVGCCPPEVMQHAVTPLLKAGGLMDRAIVVYHDQVRSMRYSTPRPRDPIRAAELARVLIPYAKRLRPLQFTATRAGEAWFDEWFHAQPEKDAHGVSKPRRANHLWRTAAYITMSRTNAVIDLDEFQRSAAIMEYEWTSLTRLTEHMQRDEHGDYMDYIERILFENEAVEPSYMFRRDLFQRLRNRKGLSPPTVKALPYLESLQKTDRVKLLVNVGVGTSKGHAYQLTQAAYDELRARRSPTDPQASPGPRPPEPRRQPSTASQELRADEQAQAPEPEPG